MNSLIEPFLERDALLIACDILTVLIMIIIPLLLICGVILAVMDAKGKLNQDPKIRPKDLEPPKDMKDRTTRTGKKRWKRK